MHIYKHTQIFLPPLFLLKEEREILRMNILIFPSHLLNLLFMSNLRDFGLVVKWQFPTRSSGTKYILAPSDITKNQQQNK